MGPASDGLGERPPRPGHSAEVQVGEPEGDECSGQFCSELLPSFGCPQIQPSLSWQEMQFGDAALFVPVGRDTSRRSRGYPQVSQALNGWPEPGQRLDESASPLSRGVEDPELSLGVIEAPASGELPRQPG